MKLKVIRKHYNDLAHPAPDQPRKLHPLDLILFDGDSSEVDGSDKVSGLIKILSNRQTGYDRQGNQSSTPSHLGLVVTSALLPYVPQLKPGKFYVLESTFSHRLKLAQKTFVDGPEDITTGEGKFGVQIRDLELVIQSYNGIAYRGRTLKNPWVWKKGEDFQTQVVPRRNLIIERFSIFYYRYMGKRYNFNPLHLGGLVFSPLRPLRSITAKGIQAGEFVTGQKGLISDTAVCSELVALAFKAVGLLPEDFNPKNFLPVDVTGVDIDGAPRLICPTLYQILPN